MRHVDLVETDDPSTPAQDEDPSFLDRVRRRPRWLVAGATVVAGLVAYQLVSDHRLRVQDDARAAALADVPLVLDPVDPAFPVFLRGSYSWRDGDVPPEVSAYLGMGVPVADVLVTGTSGSGGATEARLVALDPANAEPVWETTFAPPVEGALDGGSWCWSPEDEAATSLRCVVHWQLPPSADAPADGLWTDVTAIVEVAGADGRVLRRTDLPAGAMLGTGPWGTVVGTRDGARLTLAASEWDGTTRWTRTLDLPEVGPDTYVSIMAVEDRVLATVGPDDAGWLLSADDGATLTTLEGHGGLWGQTTLRPDGSVVVTDPERATDEPTGDVPVMLVRPDGTEVPFDGDHLEWVGLDDGTLEDALLTGTAASPSSTRTRGGEPLPADPAADDGSVARLREPDGSVRWEVPGLDVLAAIAVDGLVVARTPDELAAVDARTGRVRWRVPMPGDGVSVHQLLTDGRVILAARGAQLDAISYRGERLWSVHVQDAGEEHVVRPGPAPTPAPTGADVAFGDEVTWMASLSGRLALGVSDQDGERQEYVVFEHR